MTREFIIDELRYLDAKNQEEFIFKLYRFQLENNSVYREFVRLSRGLDFMPEKVDQLPFLPIRFFKSHQIVTGDLTTKQIFRSSGTTGSVRSQHYMHDPTLYLELAKLHFEQRYGDIENLCVLALLPGYLERGDSSLVAMVDYLIKASKIEDSGFYLDDFDALKAKIIKLQNEGTQTILIGVTHALLKFAELNVNLENVVVIETGGMKGMAEELTKDTLYAILSKSFNIKELHSEYGMTELSSQAYSTAQGKFYVNNYLKPVVTSITDPFHVNRVDETGILNFIDLANIDSCCFIETEDLGKLHHDASFEILGRLDHSEIRGCNLLVSDL